MKKFFIIVGAVSISILICFFLSFLKPVSWFPFYPVFFGVFCGGVFSGFLSRKKGWLIGIVTSGLFLFFTVFFLRYYPNPLTGIARAFNFMTYLQIMTIAGAAGPIGGFIGEKVARIKK